MCASFSEGLAPVLKDIKGLWGYIGKDGRQAVKSKYASVSEFRNGAARVTLKNSSFYIGPDGREFRKIASK